MFQSSNNPSDPARVGPFFRRFGWSLAFIWVSVAGVWPGGALAQSQPKSAPKEGAKAKQDISSKNLAFEVAYPVALRKQPISARVYVMLGPGGSRLEPRFGPDWFRPRPFFGRDVKDWK